MSVVSGLNAKVSQDGTTAVKTVGAWRFNPTNPLSSAVASNSGGGTFNLPATADSQSSYDFYDKEPPAIPGTTYTHLYQTETHEYSVPVMCESVSASCDIAGGNLIRGSASFGGNGAWTAQVVTSVTNSVTPTAFSSVGCKATWQPIVAGTLGTAASLPDVQGWEWAAARANVAYASDLTAGHMKRTKGALSATASVTLLQGATNFVTTNGTLLTPGTVGILRLFVDATTAYVMTYARINGLTPEGDIEGASQHALTIGFDWTGFAYISTTYTRGTLLTPAGVELFA